MRYSIAKTTTGKDSGPYQSVAEYEEAMHRHLRPGDGYQIWTWSGTQRSGTGRVLT